MAVKLLPVEPDHYICEREPCNNTATWRRAEATRIPNVEALLKRFPFAVDFACDQHKDDLSLDG